MMLGHSIAMHEYAREWRQDLFLHNCSGQAIIAHENPHAHEMFYVSVNIRSRCWGMN